MQKQASFFFLLLALLPLSSFAQQIFAGLVKESSFPVMNYTVFKEGYPLMVAPGGGGQFVYIEYWRKTTTQKDVQGRRETNYYLQRYGIPDYGEQWFRPLSYEGHDQIPLVLDLLKLEKHFVVFGKQYSEKDKRFNVVGRWFSFDGKSPELDATLVSKYDKGNKKDYTDRFFTSNNEKFVMWIGSEGTRNFVSIFTEEGKELYAKEMKTPYSDKYIIKDAALDDKGNPAFLMATSRQTFSLKDTAMPPVIVRYNVTEDKFTSSKIKLDSTFFLNGHLRFRSNGEAVVAGVCSDNSPMGISNGLKLGKNATRWTHFFMKRYDLDSMKVIADSVSVIPYKLQEKYGSDGANFATSEMVIDGESVILINEEHYKSGDTEVYGDIGCITFRMADGAAVWAQVIAKKQRDKPGTEYFSYTLGKYKGRLHFIFLTEMGAQGKLVCHSMDAGSGKITERVLASNEEALFYFFPKRSRMVSDRHIILIGTGDPTKNAYKLMTVAFQ
ncbi:MAG: hypothetical protein ACKVTZ_12635 [Bacteroidia bacterium]